MSTDDAAKGQESRSDPASLGELRPLHAIARDIRNHWKSPAYSARPYLDAMSTLDTLQDRYWNDTAQTVVLYFLSNASIWRGEHARRIKTELRNMLKANGYKL